MAIPTNIRTLLSGNVVEWARIEFKKTWDPEASLKTITAFANDLDNWGGGYIVIGVEEENGIPLKPYSGVPVNKVDAWQKDIFAKCKLMRPLYTPIIGVDELDGKKFIIIWCPGGDSRPYSCPKTMSKNDKERCYFIRKSSNTVIPNDDELKDLFNLANRTPFDDRVNHVADMSDLNYMLIKSYLKEIGSALYDTADNMAFADLCANMNLISTLPEYVKPKNVALMFFNPEPEKFFPCAQIDVVQFPEGDGGDKIIEQTFTGPLHEQLRAALRYIRNTIITEQVVKSPDKAEVERFFNYPYAAVEEALSNAVYHKAYDEREPIEVRVEKDMIEIISHPGPDRSVTLDGLRTFKVKSRRYRNRRIGEFLKELHLTEGRNTGFKKILDALRQNGSPLPEFETNEAHDYFIARLFVRDGFYDYEGSNGSGTTKETTKDGGGTTKETTKETTKDGGGTTKETTKETTKDGSGTTKETTKDGGGTTEETTKETTKSILINAIRRNPHITVKELAVLVGLTDDGVRYHIRKLREKGILSREGATKSGKWIVLH